MNRKEPLCLPRGSVRALLALLIVGAFIAHRVDKEVAMAVIGYYFMTRAAR
jgi:hypothetical protein